MGYMKLLIPIADLQKYKSRDLIPVECYNCHKTFKLRKHHVQCSLSEKSHGQGKFCSRKCGTDFSQIRLTLNCTNCSKEFKRISSQTKGSKNQFCSSYCSGYYNATHKTKGTRRSKIEIWLESKLTSIYSNLEIHFNRKDTINSELDIYIPSLKLAIELNGIFHYEPIYGKEKLKSIQNNDERKFQACAEKQISLCIIDTTGIKYFKEQNVKKFLDIITKIINKKLVESTGIQPDPV